MIQPQDEVQFSKPSSGVSFGETSFAQAGQTKSSHNVANPYENGH